MDIKKSIRYIANENKMIVERASATNHAAALNVPSAERGNTVCILSGGSINLETIVEILTTSY